MIEVKSIRTADNGGTILIDVLLTSDEDGKKEERSLLLLPEQYRELKIRRGLITREQFDAAEEASVLCQAVRRGRYLLSFGANSSSALCLKLRRKGFPADVAAAAVGIIQSEGAIDEGRDAVRQAELRVRHGEGRQRILSHLRSKGYGSAAIAEAEKYLDGVDFASLCRKVIEKKYGSLPTDRDDRQKCIASLRRLGFTFGQIRQAGLDADVPDDTDI